MYMVCICWTAVVQSCVDILTLCVKTYDERLERLLVYVK